MIKQYFTDGLIGLAILLSLLRTDLTEIHDIINYPEVQDIILGQTAAYLPANFHRNALQNVVRNQKYTEFDTEAISSWYGSIQNLPAFQGSTQNQIDAFLVSAAVQNGVIEQFQEADPPSQINVEENNTADGRNLSSPTLPFESASSVDVAENPSQAVADAPTVTNSLFFNNPFPGCDLTKEDLDLIDVLWRQDVDLGVGKEVFDQNLRLELEKERELEILKQNEKLAVQRLAQEKEDQQRQEQANRWLKENFMRDGETGEWVRLQNGGSSSSSSSATSSAFSVQDEPINDLGMTLEAALEYIKDLPTTETVNESIPPVYNNAYVAEPQLVAQDTQEQVQPLPQLNTSETTGFFQHQDSLEDNWTGLMSYLNMAAPDSTAQDTVVASNTTDAPPIISATNNSMPTPVEMTLPVHGQLSGLNTQINGSEFLLQNATMPSPSVDIANDFNILTPITDLTTSPAMTSQVSEVIDPTMDWGDLGDLTFFNNLTQFSSPTDDIDLQAVDNLFTDMSSQRAGASSQNLPTTSAVQSSGAINLGEDMDSLHVLGEDLKESLNSLACVSPIDNITDSYEGLEGAIGGSNVTVSSDDDEAPFTKVSRLSESSNDSGFPFNGSFSASASPSESSSLGSPASSSHDRNMTASNDTDYNPSGSKTTVAQHHVAHNHTYNTPPGQVPREVKKYAPKEPSRKGPQSRDQRRATDMKIPFTVDEITSSPVETFNEMLTKYKLTEPQLTLIRDIRRRGKNKVAAQNCRKRKVGVIVTLADEMDEMQKVRDRLLEERRAMEQETRRMRDKFGQLYAHIFQSLRDDRGEPYDPNLYSLQQSSDGNVFLVPRNVNNNNNNSKEKTNSTAAAGGSSSKDSHGGDTGAPNTRKRKALDK